MARGSGGATYPDHGPECGLTVGAIGLKFWPSTDGAVEFGYGVAPSRRCRGYTTKAVRALVAFARTVPGVTRLFA
ncbi:GNAT family N-acetyltransferase, partial [Micromonospora sp. NPDC007271]|uniref:GNAT family N-acetyltransferase n=1 Tax=Micromonospora sp. NPDC007271 TaxID=3154587 RepID=UPI003406FDA3